LNLLKSLLIPAICIGIAVFAMLDIAPAGRLTGTDLARLQWEADEYRRKHGRCAASLAELVRAPELRNLATRDEWGRVFLYECQSDGSARIRSLGADGVPGGAGKDRDQSSDAPAAGTL
jgi:Type II secretion system (T2SS), protein G